MCGFLCAITVAAACWLRLAHPRVIAMTRILWMFVWPHPFDQAVAVDAMCGALHMVTSYHVNVVNDMSTMVNELVKWNQTNDVYYAYECIDTSTRAHHSQTEQPWTKYQFTSHTHTHSEQRERTEEKRRNEWVNPLAYPFKLCNHPFTWPDRSGHKSTAR